MVRAPKITSPPGECLEWSGLYSIYKEYREDSDVYVVYMETLGTQMYEYAYISEHTTLDSARVALEGKRRGK